MNIKFDSIIFKEGSVYVAYCPELDVSSCGDTLEQAKDMLKEAVRLFIEETEKMGTLKVILDEAGFELDKNMVYVPPKILSTELINLEMEDMETANA
jgi:predicted RNase H-like HicB family nuclease